MARDDAAVHAKAIELGKLAVRATTAAGSGHPTTALSLAHLVTVLLYQVMRWDPAQPASPVSDRLVLSEGHAVPIVYAACADLGVAFSLHGQTRRMTVEDLDTLRAITSPIDGHPNPRLGFPFFDAATGSLGQGLSIAAGLAAAARLDGTDRRIYCVIGDGESREGQIWEAMDFVADHKLTNVVAVFNCNRLGQSDYVDAAQSAEALAAKAQAFGWQTATIDGHTPADILVALTQPPGDRPLAVIARTVKGWGVPELGGPGHHGQPVPRQQLDAVLGRLDEEARTLGADATAARALRPRPPQGMLQREPRREPDGFAQAAAADAKVNAAVKKGALSPRRAYGLALHALGAANPAVVALDGDVKNSTYAEFFAKAYPTHYFEGRIAEQNMVSVGAGLAAGGRIPFVSSFGRFLIRGFDQLEMALIGGANLKLVGSHIGVTIAADGPSQMALADVAFMRAYAHVEDFRGQPAMTVLTPSDAVSAYALTLAMAEHDGACYLRAVRADLPLLYKESDRFPFGGYKALKLAGPEAGGVLLVATGYLVHTCLKAAAALDASGTPASVVDAYCLPLDCAPVLQLARTQRAPIFVVEDCYTGGLASELAEVAARTAASPRIVGLNVTRIPKSGRTPDDLLRYVHLAVDDIVAAAGAAR